MATSLSTEKHRDWSLPAILLVAFLLRFLLLGLKPPHFDEGINGWFVDQLIANGFYRYDPTNYHGPFHFYVLFLFKLLFGRNLWALRLSASLFGFAAIYLIARLKEYVGQFTAYSAALLAAVSPGAVFYTRYAIHESELLFFSLLALHGYLRLQVGKDRLSLWLLGLGLAGMITTKETFILHVACFAVAVYCLRVWERFVPSTDLPKKEAKRSYTKKDVYLATGVSILFVLAFFSGFFLNGQGILDMVRAFVPWFQTGNKGNGHQKVFYYWLMLIKDLEWAAFGGVVLFPRLLMPMPRWTRLIGIYGFGVLLAYSIIPYKTPWCILNIIWPFFIIAGAVVSRLARFSRQLLLVGAAFVVVLASAALPKTIRLNFYDYDNDKEMYVYVQTYRYILKTWQLLEGLVQKNPTNRHIPINIMLSSNWPLPWMLGEFTKVAYYSNGLVPPQVDAAVVLVDQGLHYAAERSMHKKYFKEHFTLRSAQAPAIAYYDAEIFKDYFNDKTEIFTPQPQEPVKPGEGFRADYYTNPNWTGPVAFSKVESNIDFSWEENQRPLPPPFGIIFSGEINIPTDKEINYELSSDDGSQLRLDDELVIDNLGMHAMKALSAKKALKSGWHRIEVRYNDYGGGMSARLMWTLPDSPPEVIPSHNLKMSGAGE